MGTLRRHIPKLPVTPLLDAIAERGGLAATAQRRGLDAAAYERMRQAIQRGRRSGELTVHAADELCVGLLRSHPWEVYGDEWFTHLEPASPAGLAEPLAAEATA